MHPHAALLKRLYGCLCSHPKDHEGMAECYHPDATFEDIAFKLRGKKEIHAMWHMISKTDLHASFTIRHADDQGGAVDLTDEYTFHEKAGDAGRHVRNVIRSEFHFRDGLIVKHRDSCDALKWGSQALGPVKGLLTWLVPAIRRAKAKAKLDEFKAHHPEYT